VPSHELVAQIHDRMPAIPTNRGSVAVHPRVRPKALTTGTQGQSAGQNNTFCGNADVFVIYDEDANGNPVPGTKQYGCTD
jgi:hypothetical protein